jgi:predicted amidohydrolase YtcJ
MTTTQSLMVYFLRNTSTTWQPPATNWDCRCFVHCCGDGAVRRTLDGYESVQRSNGRRDSRHRVEHIEVIHPDDLPRFKELGVIASMQTGHSPLALDDGDVWPDRVGKQRWGKSFAWRDVKKCWRASRPRQWTGP